MAVRELRPRRQESSESRCSIDADEHRRDYLGADLPEPISSAVCAGEWVESRKLGCCLAGLLGAEVYLSAPGGLEKGDEREI